MTKFFLAFAAANGFLSVALGAFAAHALKSSLSPNLLVTFNTAVDYQIAHALALLFVGLAIPLWPKDRLLLVAGLAFSIGILIFSGSLYVLALTGISKLGMITPFGGVCFLLGWIALFLVAIRKTS